MALVFTGATAPAIWAQAGWAPSLFATAMMAAIAEGLIRLAPLPPPNPGLRRWRLFLAGALGVAAVGVLAFAVQYGPLTLRGGTMEQFCEGLRSGLTEPELSALADRQGYIAHPGDDAVGHYLRLEDDTSGGRYHCEARFKPDGTIARMNFTAKDD